MQPTYLLLYLLQILVVSSCPLPHGHLNTLLKRKGGGGGGRSSGGSSHSSSGSSHTSSGSSSSSGSEGHAPSVVVANPTAHTTGSAPKPGTIDRVPQYGGFFGGGAALPYVAGGRSARGLTPYALVPVPGLNFYPGVWLRPAYVYRYSQPYTFYNATAGANETEQVLCLCEQWCECGCDDNADPAYMNSLIGTGDPATWNATLVTESVVNGTESIVVNGTLPNGTYTSANGTTVTAGASGLRSRSYTVAWCGLLAAVFVML
jgi:hypothetical protein